MIKADGLKVYYEDHLAVEDFALLVEPGEIVTIIGPNGSGKSTALKAMARLLRYKEGAVYLDGVDIKSMRSRSVARTLGIVCQTHASPPDMTVADLVGRGRTPYHSLFTGLTAEDRLVVEEALADTRLSEYRQRSIYALSGGELQRAFIAMALAQQPSVLLLDEPTTYLDICFQYEVLELIRRLNYERQLTIVMVLHDINQAARYSDRLVVMSKGRIHALGTPWEIVTEELFSEIYDMQVRVLNEESTGRPFLIPLSVSDGAREGLSASAA